MTKFQILTSICAGLISTTLLTGEKAEAVVGQPFLTADASTSGFILDFFDVFGPSGAKETRVSGEITSEIGASGTVGKTLEFQSSLHSGSTLTIDGSSIFVEDVSSFGGFPFDPFQSTPGQFTYEMYALLPVDDFLDDVPNPGDITFTYDEPWAFLGPFVGDFPEQVLEMTVYYNGVFPTKEFTEPGGSTFDYVEGAFDVTRITLGVQGGPALPATVPLPATGLMLLAAMGAGIATKRRKS